MIGRICNRIVLLSLGFALPLIAGCGGNSQAGQSVTVVGSPWYGHIPVQYGIEAGIFEKHGFTVTYKSVNKSSERLAAMATGHVEFGSVGQIAMLTALSNGNDTFYWVGTQNMAKGFEGLVGGPGVTSFADLKGKKIGVPLATSADLTAKLLLQSNGISTEEVEFVNLDPASVPNAVATGTVAAGAVWEPYLGDLKQAEDVTVLGMDTDTEVYKRFQTMTGIDVLLINQAWVDKDPSRAKRFMAAYWESLAAVIADPEDAVDKLHGKYFTQPREVFEANLSRFTWLPAAEQPEYLSEQRLLGHTDYVLELLKKDGYVKQTPDFRSVINLDLLPEAP